MYIKITFSDHRDRVGSLPRNHTAGQRYSYHENPAHRYEHDQFSSLPRDHRILSWKRDLRPPPTGGATSGSTGARRGGAVGAPDIEPAGHRRSFHYDDRKEYAGAAAGQPATYIPRGGSMKRELSPARRSFDPSHYETCDR